MIWTEQQGGISHYLFSSIQASTPQFYQYLKLQNHKYELGLILYALIHGVQQALIKSHFLSTIMDIKITAYFIHTIIKHMSHTIKIPNNIHNINNMVDQLLPHYNASVTYRPV